MKELLNSYSIAEIIAFVILILLAIKEAWQLFEFFYKKIRNHFDAEYSMDKEKDEIVNKIKVIETEIENNNKNLLEAITQMKAMQEKFNSHADSQQEILNMLIESDKALTRIYIVNAHTQFTQKGYVSYYELDSIEKVYHQYKAEGGNSYIEDLMKDIKNLPIKVAGSTN